ncbi:uncharacterized protein LOC117114041 [Anneissia japonica]|uniref:uncharacterized protein LOC117114041 n=1 Tax=Anneissia japonica TaxID=1529436 RepID=UPI0014255EF5|nr:uncharacterized protein LOC117114041 [Anneissia japonica]
MADLYGALINVLGLGETIHRDYQRVQHDVGLGLVQRNTVTTRRTRRFSLLRSVVRERQRRQSEAILNIAVLITGLLNAMYAPTVTVWTRNRSHQWWTIDCLMQYDDVQWYENFRMTRRPFQLLCNQLNPYIERMNTQMRRPVSVVKLVAITVYRLATAAQG